MVSNKGEQTKGVGRHKNNAPQQCKRNEWGGSSEIKIWAMITKTIMIEINADNNTANIFYPEINNTVGINLSTQMQTLREIQKSTKKNRIPNVWTKPLQCGLVQQ